MNDSESSIDPDIRAISRMKLQTLAKRRDARLARYLALDEQVRRETDAATQIEILARGLLDIRSADESPELRNTSDMLAVAGAGGLPPSARPGLLRRLQRELSQGIARSDWAWGFGVLVDRWAEHIVALEGAPPEEPSAEALRAYLEEPSPDRGVAFVDAVIARSSDLVAPVREAIAKFSAGEAMEAPTDYEIIEATERLRHDPYRTPKIRQRASAIAEDRSLRNEYAGAIAAMLAEPDRLERPKGGHPVRSLWAKNKRRIYLDEELLSAIFLEIVGRRWASELQDQLRQRSIADDRFDPTSSDAHASDMFFLASVGELAEAYMASDNAVEAPEQIELLVASVYKRITWERFAAPGAPIHVLRADLQQFGPSVPHRAALCMLEHLGASKPWLYLFQTFLTPEIHTPSGVRPVVRGIFPDHPLSLVLGDALLLSLDLHVRDRAQTRLVRLLDDITVVSRSAERITAAWQALLEGTAALGLPISADKTGSVTLSGTLPPGLPAGEVRIESLRLDPEGRWQIDTALVDAFARKLAPLLLRERPLLETIDLYNTYAKFLLRSMAPLVRLGPEHSVSVGQHMTRLHETLFGDHGIEALVRARLARQLDPDLAARIPPALFYWPITAGGLGLYHPLLSTTSFWTCLRLSPMPDPPSEPLDPEEPSWPWRSYLQSHGEPLRPRRPDQTPALEGLLADFVRRGREVRGEDPDEEIVRPENNLGAYWQWIIFACGPDLVETFGGFRLLETELVPLFLIRQGLASPALTTEPLGL